MHGEEADGVHTKSMGNHKLEMLVKLICKQANSSQNCTEMNHVSPFSSAGSQGCLLLLSGLAVHSISCGDSEQHWHMVGAPQIWFPLASWLSLFPISPNWHCEECDSERSRHSIRVSVHQCCVEVTYTDGKPSQFSTERSRQYILQRPSERAHVRTDCILSRESPGKWKGRVMAES